MKCPCYIPKIDNFDMVISKTGSGMWQLLNIIGVFDEMVNPPLDTRTYSKNNFWF